VLAVRLLAPLRARFPAGSRTGSRPGSRPGPRLRSGQRRMLPALLVLSALFALATSGPFHASVPAASCRTAPIGLAGAGAVPQVCHAPAPDRPTHDPDLCPICHATAQARLALRSPLRTAAPPPTDLRLLLAARAPIAPPRAAVPGDAHPRAPPLSASAAV
jgi:hypothetical protein